MNPPLGRRSEHLYALLRIVAGGLFIFHGAQKLFGAFGGHAQPIGSLMGAAGVIETVCGLLIMVGLFGGLAGLLASGEMAFAYFMRHQPKAPWPIQNQGELAVLYCFIFLYVAARGSGLYSVDAALHSSRDRRWVGSTPEPIQRAPHRS
jgi:putative oxidoreductase